MSPEIAQALAECRLAFASNPGAESAWCCHHEILWEPLTEPYEKRIAYILSSKPESEHLLRFQNFRPCTQQTEVEALYADYDAKRALLDADYDAKRALLYADYDAKRALLYADYDAKRALLYADYNAKRALLYADYDAKRALLDADYDAKRAPLYADYDAKRALLYADYNAKRAPLYKADVPLGTWMGKSIFV